MQKFISQLGFLQNVRRWETGVRLHNLVMKCCTTSYNNIIKISYNIHREKELEMVRDEHEEDPLNVSLPQTFTVKYIGKLPARGLWGIKHTRDPVDELVMSVRSQKPGTPLPLLDLIVSQRGVSLSSNEKNLNYIFDSGPFEIDTISYGVQDLVYTRVFAMIVVQSSPDLLMESSSKNYKCYAFVCNSRSEARKLTYALATAFSKFSARRIQKDSSSSMRFAIDLKRDSDYESPRRGIEEDFDSSEA